MSNVISSAIFCVRNVDKAGNQDKVGRWAVATGQAKKVVDHVVNLDGKIGKTAKEAVSVFEQAAKRGKIFDYAGKAVKFASDNVNPLICISAGIDILRAEDKDSALVTNAAALTSMFAVEKLMKEHLDDVVKIKGIDKIAQKVVDFASKYKHGGKVGSIVHGVAFVTGSCLAYSTGEKFGKLILNKTDEKS